MERGEGEESMHEGSARWRLKRGRGAHEREDEEREREAD